MISAGVTERGALGIRDRPPRGHRMERAANVLKQPEGNPALGAFFGGSPAEVGRG